MFAAFMRLLVCPGAFLPTAYLAGRKCALLYHPAPRACFSRHFGPGPRM
jgi:hypothetical protein